MPFAPVKRIDRAALPEALGGGAEDGGARLVAWEPLTDSLAMLERRLDSHERRIELAAEEHSRLAERTEQRLDDLADQMSKQLVQLEASLQTQIGKAEERCAGATAAVAADLDKLDRRVARAENTLESTVSVLNHMPTMDYVNEVRGELQALREDVGGHADKLAQLASADELAEARAALTGAEADLRRDLNVIRSDLGDNVRSIRAKLQTESRVFTENLHKGLLMLKNLVDKKLGELETGVGGRVTQLTEDTHAELEGVKVTLAQHWQHMELTEERVAGAVIEHVNDALASEIDACAKKEDLALMSQRASEQLEHAYNLAEETRRTTDTQVERLERLIEEEGQSRVTAGHLETVEADTEARFEKLLRNVVELSEVMGTKASKAELENAAQGTTVALAEQQRVADKLDREIAELNTVIASVGKQMAEMLSHQERTAEQIKEVDQRMQSTVASALSSTSATAAEGVAAAGDGGGGGEGAAEEGAAAAAAAAAAATPAEAAPAAEPDRPPAADLHSEHITAGLQRDVAQVLDHYERMQAELEYLHVTLGEIREVMEGRELPVDADQVPANHALWKQLITFRKLFVVTGGEMPGLESSGSEGGSSDEDDA